MKIGKRKIDDSVLVVLIALMVAAVAFEGQIFKLGGFGLGHVDIFVKDSNGQPIEGAKCEMISYTSESLYATSNSAGICHFYDLPAGEMQPWGVSCTNPSGITRQGSVEVKPPISFGKLTSNVYVTLPGCSSSGGVVTTTSTTQAGCSSHAVKKCYIGDVYWYDSCNQRESRYDDCGTFGCTGGNCIDTPPTTTVTGTTSTTIKGCYDVCTGSGCYTNIDGTGFRCVLDEQTKCRQWVKDSSCEGVDGVPLWGIIAALVAALGGLMLILKRK